MKNNHSLRLQNIYFYQKWKLGITSLLWRIMLIKNGIKWMTKLSLWLIMKLLLVNLREKVNSTARFFFKFFFKFFFNFLIFFFWRRQKCGSLVLHFWRGFGFFSFYQRRSSSRKNISKSQKSNFNQPRKHGYRCFVLFVELSRKCNLTLKCWCRNLV